MVRELFGVEPDPWQWEVLELFPYKPRIGLQACKGPGKLLAKSLIINTPNGAKKWGDLQKGDLVFAEDGSPTEIIGVYQNGVMPMYRVTFNDGSSTLAGAEHLWKVQGRTERRKGVGWTIIDTAEILRRGVTIPNGKWEQKQFIIPRQGPAQMDAAKLPIDCYLMGVWLGDGSKGQPIYTKPYLEVEHEINRRGYRTARGKDGKTVRVLDALRQFQEVECFGRGSHERFIPRNFKMSSVAQRTDLLCGLMDSDGCIGDDGHMEFSTTSQRLSDDVVWLARSLGCVAYIKASIKEGWYRDLEGVRIDCRDCYRVTIVTDFNPFRIEHKASRWKNPLRSKSTERYLTRFIESIVPEGEEDSMCIEVAHPSHCYLANDFIVTHNTCLLAWIAWNFLLTRPNPQCAATSISGDNLSTTFWRELAKWRQKNPMLVELYEWTKTKVFLKERADTHYIEARTWPKTGNTQEQSDTLAGIHDDYVLFIIDEAGGIPEAILVSAEAALSSCIEGHIVMAGNPTRLDGALAMAAKKHRKDWHIVEITGDPDDPMRSPRMDIDWCRKMIRDFGRDHAYVLVNVLGRFPPSSLNALIGPEEIQESMRRFYREHQLSAYPRTLGVDVARFGDDSSCIAPKQGPQMFPFKKRRNIDSIQGASWVNREAIDFHPQMIFVDGTGGYGSGWCDQLGVLGQPHISVHFSSKASKEHLYSNKRTEMAFEFVNWIKRGGALPPDNVELEAALTRSTYTFVGDKMQLAPKEIIKVELGYSPDDMDGAMLNFAEPVVLAAQGYSRPRGLRAQPDPFSELDRQQKVSGMQEDFW